MPRDNMKWTPDKEEKMSMLDRLKGLLFKPSIEAHEEMTMELKKLSPQDKRDKDELRKLLNGNYN